MDKKIIIGISAAALAVLLIVLAFFFLPMGGGQLPEETPKEPITITVTFLMNDGTDAVYKVVEYTVGSGEFVIPEDPDRGLPYLFNGWYLQNIGGEEFDFATLMEEGGNVDVTLYAQWLIKFSAVIRSSDSGSSSGCPKCGCDCCRYLDDYDVWTCEVDGDLSEMGAPKCACNQGGDGICERVHAV